MKLRKLKNYSSLVMMVVAPFLILSCSDNMEPSIQFFEENGQQITDDSITIDMRPESLNFALELHIVDNKEIGDVSIDKQVDGGTVVSMLPNEFRIFQLDAGKVNKYLLEVTGNQETANQLGLPTYRKGQIIEIFVTAQDKEGNSSSKSITVSLN